MNPQNDGLPIVARVDVAICGGTAAAVAAATAAARAGASVFLGCAETYLGEDLCATGECLWLSIGSTDGSPILRRLFPASVGLPDGRPVPPARLKRVLDEALIDAGVVFRFLSHPEQLLVDAGGRVAGVVFATRSGRYAVEARHVVDATATAVVADVEHGTAWSAAPRLRAAAVRDDAGSDVPPPPDEPNRAPAGRIAAEADPFADTLLPEDPLAVETALDAADARLRGSLWTPGADWISDRCSLSCSRRLVPGPLPDGFSVAGPVAPDWPDAPASPEERFRRGEKAGERAAALALSAPAPDGPPRPLPGRTIPPASLPFYGVQCTDPRALREAIAFTHGFPFPPVRDTARRGALGGAASGRALECDTARRDAAPPSEEKPGSAGILPAESSRAGSPRSQGGILPAESSRAGCPRSQEGARPFDVLVVGGGTAGAPAAIAAARAGARVLCIEPLGMLGGTSTAGTTAFYYHGYRQGFSAECIEAMNAVYGDSKNGNYCNAVWKAEWLRRELEKAGGEVWFGATATGVLLAPGERRVRGVVVHTRWGCRAVAASLVIDATGNADIAAFAGAPVREAWQSDFVFQGSGTHTRPFRPACRNSDWTFLLDSDIADQTRAFVVARRKAADAAFDVTPIAGTRERRQIVGDITLTPADIYLGTFLPDTLVRCHSVFDTHGMTVHPLFQALPPDRRALDAWMPMGALLPKGWTGLAATGLAVSAQRDTMPVLRMIAEVQNQAYALGLAAAWLAADGLDDFRRTDFARLRRALVDFRRCLPSEALVAPLRSADTLLPALGAVLDGPLSTHVEAALAYAHPDRTVQVFSRNVHDHAADDAVRLRRALMLAALGAGAGESELLDALRGAHGWDAGWNFRGMSQYGRSMSPLDDIVAALGRIASEKAAPDVLRLAAAIGPETELSHVRAVALYAEGLAGVPALRPILAEALSRALAAVGPLHVWRSLADEFAATDGDWCSTATRNASLKELFLARALLRCGDDRAQSGRAALQAYEHDIRGQFAAAAHAARRDAAPPSAGAPGSAEKPGSAGILPAESSRAGSPRSQGLFGAPIRVDGVGAKGMAIARDGARLFVGAGPVLHALDASDPLHPRLLGSLGGFDNLRQIRVRGDFAYVVSRETGLYVVDVSDPARMRLRSRYDTVEMATGIEVAGDVAFVSERIYGIEAVDVSNPDRPEFIALRKTPESQSCRYRDGYLYSGEWGVGEVTVFDARDMRSWRAVATAELHGLGDGLELSGDRLFCSTGHHARHCGLADEEAFGNGRGLDIFDIADPARPRHLGRAAFPRMTAHEEDYWTVRVAGSLAFCADSHNGLFAVDVSDTRAPRVVDRLCIPQEGRDWPSACISSIEPGEGCLYMTAWPGGFYVVPVAGVTPEARPLGTPPAHPEVRETPQTDAAAFHVWHPAAAGLARSVAIRGDIAYAAFGDAGLHALRLDERRGFVPVGELPGERRVTDCCFVGDRLLTAEGLDGFALYELPAPGKFREVARRAAAGTGGAVAFWCWAPDDAHMVLSARDGSYAFVALEDFLAGREATDFVLGGACAWHRYPADKAIDGRYPVLYPYNGVEWVAMGGAPGSAGILPAVCSRAGSPRSQDGILPAVCSRAGSPRSQAATPPVADQRNGVCRFGDLFLCTVKDGFVLLSPDGAVAAPWRRLGPDGHRGAPSTDDRLVLLTGRSDRRATVWDFADPSSPVLLADYALSGHPDLGAFWRGRAIIPAGHQGLLMERRDSTSGSAGILPAEVSRAGSPRSQDGILPAVCSRAGSPRSQAPTLYLAGDSTLDERGGDESRYASWGAALRPFLRDGCSIVNWARGGRSTTSFFREGWWDRILETLRAGDFVLIQFGHNDQKLDKPDVATPIPQYMDNLRRMAREVRERGATPIFATSIVRLTFGEDGRLVDPLRLDDWAAAMREIAAELGVELVEMRELTRKAANDAGEAEALTWHGVEEGGLPDRSHPAVKGARIYARLFLDEIRRRNLPVARLFVAPDAARRDAAPPTSAPFENNNAKQ